MAQIEKKKPREDKESKNRLCSRLFILQRIIKLMAELKWSRVEISRAVVTFVLSGPIVAYVVVDSLRRGPNHQIILFASRELSFVCDIIRIGKTVHDGKSVVLDLFKVDEIGTRYRPAISFVADKGLCLCRD